MFNSIKRIGIVRTESLFQCQAGSLMIIEILSLQIQEYNLADRRKSEDSIMVSIECSPSASKQTAGIFIPKKRQYGIRRNQMGNRADFVANSIANLLLIHHVPFIKNQLARLNLSYLIT